MIFHLRWHFCCWKHKRSWMKLIWAQDMRVSSLCLFSSSFLSLLCLLKCLVLLLFICCLYSLNFFHWLLSLFSVSPCFLSTLSHFCIFSLSASFSPPCKSSCCLLVFFSHSSILFAFHPSLVTHAVIILHHLSVRSQCVFTEVGFLLSPIYMQIMKPAEIFLPLQIHQNKIRSNRSSRCSSHPRDEIKLNLFSGVFFSSLQQSDLLQASVSRGVLQPQRETSAASAQRVSHKTNVSTVSFICAKVLDTNECAGRMFPPISSLRAEVRWAAVPLMSTWCCCDQTLTTDLLFIKSQSDLCRSFRTKYLLTLLLSLSDQLAVLLQVYWLLIISVYDRSVELHQVELIAHLV